MSRASYYFAILRPVRHPATKAVNGHLLGLLTLGIEVTEPELARCCGLGNIDPQHDGGQDRRTAIEVAIDRPLPPRGATLVTIRPDPDAFGAMALLDLRVQGYVVHQQMRARIALIAQHDGHRLGPWRRWRRSHPPLPRPSCEPLDTTPHTYRALAASLQLHADDPAHCVGIMKQWLTEGALPAPASAIVARADVTLFDFWNRGNIRITRPEGWTTVMCSPIPAPLSLAYRNAPIVIAEGRFAQRRKLTIAQFEPGWIDLVSLRGHLTKLEPGWGGSRTILGSPQGSGTKLTADALFAASRRYLGQVHNRGT